MSLITVYSAAGALAQMLWKVYEASVLVQALIMVGTMVSLSFSHEPSAWSM